MGNNLGNEECVRSALTELAELTKENAPEVDPVSKKIIVRAMNDYIQECDIQVAGCKTLNNLLVSAQPADFLYSMDVVGKNPKLNNR